MSAETGNPFASDNVVNLVQAGRARWKIEIDVGMTTGRGRQDSAHPRHGLAPKRILLYPLYGDIQLCLKGNPQVGH